MANPIAWTWRFESEAPEFIGEVTIELAEGSPRARVSATHRCGAFVVFDLIVGRPMSGQRCTGCPESFTFLYSEVAS